MADAGGAASAATGDSWAAAEALHARLVRGARPEVLHSLRVLEDVLERYGRREVALSFNGGKDCTVLLHLLRAAAAAVARRRREAGAPCQWRVGDGERTPLGGLITVYFRDPDEFPEVEAFMGEAAAEHGFRIVELAGDFKAGLTQLLAEHPIKAVLMGQRRIDPGARDLAEEAPTDSGWPQFLRVNPVLEWDHAAVWRFLRENALPYCELYDRGYTSLGNVHNTRANPALRRPDGGYAPAHELEDPGLERAGRFKREK